MAHLGDFDTSTIVYGKFSTYRPSTGATFTLAGTPALSVYKDNSVTQSTTGVTLTADFDSVTGLNHFAIDTSADGAFYAAGSFFDIVITTGTVDSVSVTGSVVGSFTLRKDSALKPTTAGRTLDVSAGGEAGVDWANVGSPTTAVNLSATNIDVDQIVASVSGAVGSVAAGGIAAASFAAGAIDAAAIAANAIDDSAIAADVTAVISDAVWNAATATYGSAGSYGLLVETNIDATVSSRLATAGYTTPPTTAENADKLLGRNLNGGADGTRTVQDALRLLRNKASVVAGTLTVTQEDDTTTAWTATVATTAGDPISSVDPA